MEFYPNNFSVWCDFIERDFLQKKFPDLIESGIISGMTSNPVIFRNAIKDSPFYDEDKKNIKNLTSKELYEEIVIKDIRGAADILLPIYESSDDGLVSVEVSPYLANDAQETVKEGIRLFEVIDRPNIMIKIPATEAGYEAIETLVKEGINVNATLVFSPKQARNCLRAIERGNKYFQENNTNKDLPRTVISVFISRFDRKLDKILSDNNMETMKFGIMNASFIYQDIEGIKLPNIRCLFASTGVNDNEIDGAYYITNLMYKNAINTAPLSSIKALIDNFDVKAPIPPDKVDILKYFSQVKTAGVNIDALYSELLEEGLKQFENAFDELMLLFKNENNDTQKENEQNTIKQAIAKINFKDDPSLPSYINRLRKYLSELVAYGGSDLHIKSDAATKGRVNGEIVVVDNKPFSKEEVRLLAKDILRDKYETFIVKKNVDFMYKLNNNFRFRVNIFFQVDGISAAFRAIPIDIPTVDLLDLPPIINTFATKQRGLILVTGPTGCGKSTTLATIINNINQMSQKHIITIEDPVEFIYEDEQSIINQRAIGQSATTFSDALRASLREDPDVIMVGEMRDVETIRVAIQAAETGHLVLSTLHTLDAKDTISRVINMFEGNEQEQIRKSLSSVLQAVVSQRLIRRKSGGRIAAVEVLVNNSRVETLIADKREHEIKDAIEEGRTVYKSQSFNQALLELYTKGLINYYEALRAATSSSDLKILLDNYDAKQEGKQKEYSKQNSNKDVLGLKNVEND